MRFSISRLIARTLFAFALLAGTVGTAATASASPELVHFNDNRFRAGTILVRNSERHLYLVLRGGKAIRYDVAVGKPGKSWQGQTYIDGKHWQPAWSPPAVVKRDFPHLPDVIAGGAPNNPMGVAAMTLAGGGQYAIHGTNRPNLIGGAVSYGCIRMRNQDIVDLFQRVSVRTPVIVIN